MLFSKHKSDSGNNLSDSEYKRITLSALNKKLESNEFVKFSTGGYIQSKRFYIFITNTRVHLIKKNNDKKFYIHSIGFENIKAIDTSLGILYGMIKLQIDSKKILIKNIKKDHTERFADILCDQISGYETKTYNVFKLKYNDNVLQTLEDLKKNGIISDEDYDAQKSEILAS